MLLTRPIPPRCFKVFHIYLLLLGRKDTPERSTHTIAVVARRTFADSERDSSLGGIRALVHVLRVGTRHDNKERAEMRGQKHATYTCKHSAEERGMGGLIEQHIDYIMSLIDECLSSPGSNIYNTSMRSIVAADGAPSRKESRFTHKGRGG